MKITGAAPQEFSDDDRAVFGKLVQEGGEVDSNVLAMNIKCAKALVVGRCSDDILGIAALKRPQASYRKRIGNQAGADLAEEIFPYELGYIYLRPEMRGKGRSRCLVAHALDHADGAGVFATARVDNIAMVRTLERMGFRSVGEDYNGRYARIIRTFIRLPL